MGLLSVLQEANLFKLLPDVMMLIVPIWVAVVFGVLIGWVWKPKWVTSTIKNLTFPQNDFVSSIPSFSLLKSQLPGCFFPFSGTGLREIDSSSSCSMKGDTR